MIYTLTLCLGMFLSRCGQVRTYDFLTLAECEAAKASISKEAIGSGYAICALKTKPQEDRCRDR